MGRKKKGECPKQTTYDENFDKNKDGICSTHRKQRKKKGKKREEKKSENLFTKTREQKEKNKSINKNLEVFGVS